MTAQLTLVSHEPDTDDQLREWADRLSALITAIKAGDRDDAALCRLRAALSEGRTLCEQPHGSEARAFGIRARTRDLLDQLEEIIDGGMDERPQLRLVT